MNKFTHGIIVLHPNDGDNEEVSVIHFIGLWNEPTDEDINQFKNELKNDPNFGLTEIFDELEFLVADKEQIDIFNNLMNDNADFDDINTIHLN